MLRACTCTVLLTLTAPPSSAPPAAPPPAPAKSADPVVRAATEFLASLKEEQRKEAAKPFADSSRTQWNYLPGDRAGIRLGSLDGTQRPRVDALLATTLSEKGVTMVNGIIQLDALLRSLSEERGAPDTSRDPGGYRLCIFGEPGAASGWGWRLEGHHVSLNYSALDREVSVLPLFLGAAPATVPSGRSNAGWRALGEQQDAALRLIAGLTLDQRAKALLPGECPRDIILRHGHERELMEPKGLAAGELSAEQRASLEAVVVAWTNLLKGPIADQELARIRGAGIETIVLGFAGEPVVGKVHYIRLHGPTFVIEFDCTSQDPNHIHTVWHDPQRNFLNESLERHRRESPH